MSRLRVALIVLVMLNLFLAGALVAGYASLRTGKRIIAAGSLRVAGAELPPDQRRAFRRALRETRRSMRPMIEASRGAKERAAELLRQYPVDQGAVNAALDRARVATRRDGKARGGHSSTNRLSEGSIMPAPAATLSPAAIAFNRFGLGARPDDAPPSDPERYILAQFDRFEPRPARFAALADAGQFVAGYRAQQQASRRAVRA